MSEPKRYTSKTEGTVLGSPHWGHPEGEWVKWEDYARLKAEVERLTFDPLTYLDDQGEWMPRHTHLAAVERLKAEVERLEHQVNYWRIEAETDNARWLRCLEDKERLTKAGDAMADRLMYQGYPATVPAWDAAKGVQS